MIQVTIRHSHTVTGSHPVAHSIHQDKSATRRRMRDPCANSSAEKWATRSDRQGASGAMAPSRTSPGKSRSTANKPIPQHVKGGASRSILLGTCHGIDGSYKRTFTEMRARSSGCACSRTAVKPSGIRTARLSRPRPFSRAKRLPVESSLIGGGSVRGFFLSCPEIH